MNNLDRALAMIQDLLAHVESKLATEQDPQEIERWAEFRVHLINNSKTESE